MHDQKNRTMTNGAYGDPALLIVNGAVAQSYSIGIVKNQLGRFKANTVLLVVAPIFNFVPFKKHALIDTRIHTAIITICTYRCQYNKKSGHMAALISPEYF